MNALSKLSKQEMASIQNAITVSQYSAFQKAYDFFNAKLFDSSLPQVMVTLQRKANTHGYFHAVRFANRADKKERAHELALNPDTFSLRSDAQILSTLVHEMAHVWQEAHGKPSRTAYHNKEWAQKMKEIGLHPSSTAAPGGKETGQKVSHYIVESGPFDRRYNELKTGGFKLDWQSSPEAKKENKKESKQKFTCPSCGQNAWAKPSANLNCGDCDETMEA